MIKNLENLIKLQCFGQNSYGSCGGCTPCFIPCPPPCPPRCPIVYKTITRIINPAPTPTPTPTPTVTPQYAYIYNTAAETVGASSPVTFAENGQLSSGITHTAGSNTVTLTEAGTYDIRYTVTGTAANQFYLALNGTEVPGSLYGSMPETTGDARLTTVGSAIITAAANDTRTLVNNSATAVPLATQTGGTGANVNASMTIVKLA